MSIEIYGCVDWTDGSITFDHNAVAGGGECLYDACMNWNDGRIEVSVCNYYCDDTYYGCMILAGGTFKVLIPDECLCCDCIYHDVKDGACWNSWELSVHYGVEGYEFVKNDGACYINKDEHTSTVNDEPGVGVNWTDHWWTFESMQEWIEEEIPSTIMLKFTGWSTAYADYNGEFCLAKTGNLIWSSTYTPGLSSTAYRSYTIDSNKLTWLLTVSRGNQTVFESEETSPRSFYLTNDVCDGAGSWAIDTFFDALWDDPINHGGGCYNCITNHTSEASNEPGVGGSWEDYWVSVGSVVARILELCPTPCSAATTWADSTAYEIGDLVNHAGADCFRTLQDHTSVQTNDEPNVGTNWEDYWETIDYYCG